MYFETTIAGIECDVEVLHYTPSDAGKYSGPWEDSWPGSAAEFEYVIRHKHASVEKYLNQTISEEDEQRLLEEWESRND